MTTLHLFTEGNYWQMRLTISPTLQHNLNQGNFLAWYALLANVTASLTHNEEGAR